MTDEAVQEGKKLVGIEGELSVPELVKQLSRRMRSVHPDSFTDHERKKEAEEQFKQINDIIERIRDEADSRALELSRADDSGQQMETELVRAEAENAAKVEKIRTLQLELANANDRIRRLEEQLRQSGSEEIRIKTREFNRNHGLRSSHVVTAGIGIAAGASWLTFSRVSNTVGELRSMIPGNAAWLDWTGVTVILTATAWIAARAYRNARFRNRVRTVLTDDFAVQFQAYLEKSLEPDQRLRSFSNRDVVSFLQSYSGRHIVLLRFLHKRTLWRSLMDDLKECFITDKITRARSKKPAVKASSPATGL